MQATGAMECHHAAHVCLHAWRRSVKHPVQMPPSTEERRGRAILDACALLEDEDTREKVQEREEAVRDCDEGGVTKVLVEHGMQPSGGCLLHARGRLVEQDQPSLLSME